MIGPILVQTPLQRLAFLDDKRGNRFWIKRDDLLPFSFGGNKVRIGMAFREDCLRSGCDAMILYGDRRSNLCRVLSAICAAVYSCSFALEERIIRCAQTSVKISQTSAGTT